MRYHISGSFNDHLRSHVEANRFALLDIVHSADEIGVVPVRGHDGSIRQGYFVREGVALVLVPEGSHDASLPPVRVRGMDGFLPGGDEDFVFAFLESTEGLHAVGLLDVGMHDGDLGRITRLVKLTGFVASTPGFTEQPKVINGASDLMVELLGDAGRHARSAVGVAALPLGVAVEIEGIFQVK